MPEPLTPVSTSVAELPTAGQLPRLAIFGAGGLGREVVVLAHQLNEVAPTWELFGFFDDQLPAAPDQLSLPYRGSSADLLTLGQQTPAAAPLHVAVAMGNSRHRAAVVSRLRAAGPGLHFPALIHPGVARQPYQQLVINEGCIIQQGCILTTHIQLGRFVLLNLGCTVGHDAVLDDFCSLMPHANVGGAAHLETGVYLGTNATVIQGVQVGAQTIIGAGAVAVRDLPAGCTAVGVPARVIKGDAT